MTSLLTHPAADATRPSYRPKINNQPLKKFLNLLVSWVKVIKMAKSWLSKSIFYVNNSPNLSKVFFIEEHDFRGTLFYWNVLKTLIFKLLYFLRWQTIFEEFYSTEIKTQKLFKGFAIGFGPKGMPGRMCNIVRWKWRHTNVAGRYNIIHYDP